jgi:hypothetical protein
MLMRSTRNRNVGGELTSSVDDIPGKYVRIFPLLLYKKKVLSYYNNRFSAVHSISIVI